VTVKDSYIVTKNRYFQIIAVDVSIRQRILKKYFLSRISFIKQQNNFLALIIIRNFLSTKSAH